jgi:hypothetical protein
MSKLFRPIIAFVAANALLYLGFAFIAWQLDPSQWHQDMRVIFVALGVMLGAFAALLSEGIT